jgi:hypothetical protein
MHGPESRRERGRFLLSVGIGLRDSQMSQDASRRVKQAYTRSDY